MKHIMLTAAVCIATAVGASAQATLVKEAKAKFKGVNSRQAYEKAVEAITPAFTNPETAQLAETFFVPGKGGFDAYDEMYKMAMVGQQVDHAGMGHNLLDGYNFFMQAFALDSLPDEKGKVKPKHSKEMVNIITAHQPDFDRAAVDFWQAGEYGAAYDAWEVALDIPSNPRYRSTNIQPYADTIVGQVRYNQGLAAFQAHQYDRSARALKEALRLSNQPARSYEIAYEAARLAQDSTLMRQFAQEGWQKFGGEHPVFLQWNVNSYIDHGDYDGALKVLDEAVAANPNEAAIYVSYGLLNEDRGNLPEAKANYNKAAQLNPQMADPYFYLGRVLLTEYENLEQAANSMPQAEYNKYHFETLRPVLTEAAANFEKAYSLNNELTSVLNPLKSIYYQLQDAKNLERIEQLIMYGD